MNKLKAQLQTNSGSRYLQQLCKHWSHKFEVQFDPHVGRIQLPLGEVELQASESVLDVLIAPKPEADVARLQSVVESHLNRFAFREAPLEFVWAAD